MSGETPPVVTTSRSQSVYHGGTKPNCPSCDGKGWHEWPDGFAVPCARCGGWGDDRSTAALGADPEPER